MRAEKRNGKLEAVKEENGQEAAKTYFLSKEERLTLQNINLRRQMLEVSMQQQVQQLEKEQAEAVTEINTRLSINIAEYRININTGECTFDASLAKPAVVQPSA